MKGGQHQGAIETAPGVRMDSKEAFPMFSHAHVIPREVDFVSRDWFRSRGRTRKLHARCLGSGAAKGVKSGLGVGWVVLFTEQPKTVFYVRYSHGS